MDQGGAMKHYPSSKSGEKMIGEEVWGRSPCGRRLRWHCVGVCGRRKLKFHKGEDQIFLIFLFLSLSLDSHLLVIMGEYIMFRGGYSVSLIS